jgi:peroxiredoxin Q/BCP
VRQACRFRDEYNRFVDAGAAVFGISSDSPEENAAFAKVGPQRSHHPALA